MSVPPAVAGGGFRAEMTTPNKRFLGIIIGICVLLTLPYVAMKLGTEGVDWKLFDFIAAAVMLFGAGIAIEIALRLITKWEYRIAACVAILIGLTVVWAELAVGIFGTPLAGS
jgi:hypothetical protein